MKKELEELLFKIDKLIENKLVNEACQEYIKFAKKIQEEELSFDKSIKAEFYASFAYFLFDVSEYEESLNMFVKAQNHGYSKTKIKEFIWQAFVEPNLNDFKEMYIKNIEFLLSKKCILKAVDFEQLSFWLIPTLTENQYYFYDKNEEIIKGKICLNDNSDTNISITSVDEFADFLIVSDWNFNRIKKYANEIKKNNKKTYVVIREYKEFLSLFQVITINKNIISELLIFDNFNSMKEYFKNCNSYLPRNIIDFTFERNIAQKAIDEIHEYRITSKGRKGDNVLLSICIPSYNRGKLAYDNVINNLKLYYDEEIEVVLSNNGTENETKEYYEKIENMNDSRLNYFVFSENKGACINFCKVCEMARGKFVLLLSDEDLVNCKVLHNIMNILEKGKNTLSILRTRGDVQGAVPSFKLKKPGSDALFTYMLTSNYMSGIIFNNELLKKYSGINYVKQNLNNSTCLYYPHMVWELLLCQYGHVQGVDTILINEGKSEETYIGMEDKCKIPQYAMINGRLDQHKGFFEIFKDLEICKKDFDVFREMYIQLSNKTIFLVSLSINVYYKNTDMNLFEIIEQVYELCIKYLDEIYDINSDKRLKKHYNEDRKRIEKTYNYLKNTI